MSFTNFCTSVFLTCSKYYRGFHLSEIYGDLRKYVFILQHQVCYFIISFYVFFMTKYDTTPT